jgi:hypothetical protein
MNITLKRAGIKIATRFNVVSCKLLFGKDTSDSTKVLCAKATEIDRCRDNRSKHKHLLLLS